MKKPLQSRTAWQSAGSFLMLAFFIWLAAASGVREDTEYLGDGVYQTTYQSLYRSDVKRVVTGKRDEHRKFHGPVVIEYVGIEEKRSREEVTMVHDLRHGVSKMTYTDGSVGYTNYNMGHVIDDIKSVRSGYGGESAFQILHKEHPWYVLAFDGFGYTAEETEAFVEKVVEEITALEYRYSRFDEGYDDVLDEMEDDEDTEEITLAHRFLAEMRGLEDIKNHPFRMAVLDQHRMDEKGTAEIVSTYYPGYYSWILRSYTASDFEVFCDTLDAMMLSYGPLDSDDPLFLDSIDVRFNRVLNELVYSKAGYDALVSQEKSDGGRSGMPSRSVLRRLAEEMRQGKAAAATPKDIAQHIATDMDDLVKLADPLRIAIREAMYPEMGRLAEVTTAILSVDSETSVTIEGFVLDDGGADVTERGVVYGTLYNPTVDDAIIASGEGTGKFSVTISGLEPETKLFVRAYAKNSVGVTYGNQVEVVPSMATGLAAPDNPGLAFNLFPVPARDRLWVRITDANAGMAEVSLISISGQLIRSQLVNLGQSQDVAVDIAGLQPGVYFVRLTLGGSIAVRQVIVQ